MLIRPFEDYESEENIGLDDELDRKRAMWINADRMVYSGLLGKPSVRAVGAYAVYFSRTVPHRISVDGGQWTSAQLSVVRPYVSHQLASDDPMICTIFVEPESVDADRLPCFLTDLPNANHPEVLFTLRHALRRFSAQPSSHFSTTSGFDTAFFGAPLQRRLLDPRIQDVLQIGEYHPESQMSAASCAARAYLSVSRFLHLFRAEVGVSFRDCRAWKRARSVLRCVTRRANLADVALEAGYPDSSHFSHSMRRYYGIAPRMLFRGGRNMTLIDVG